MKILVTGATGYIGCRLLPKLVDLGYMVSATIRPGSASKKSDGPAIHWIETGNNMAAEIRVFNPDIVIHLASHITASDDGESRERIISTNISFATQVCASLTQCKTRLFLDTGTFAQDLYNDGSRLPAYFYSASKSAFREFFKYYNLKRPQLKYALVTPYSVYGGESTKPKLIDYIFESLNARNAINMTKGEQVLDFVHIDDLVDLYVDIVGNANGVQQDAIFYGGTGIGTTPREVANLIGIKTGREPNINWGGLPYRDPDTMHSIAHVARNMSQTQWRALITLEDGISSEVLRKFGV